MKNTNTTENANVAADKIAHQPAQGSGSASTPGQHHPSCTPNNRDLVWLCAQCGGHEDASQIEAQRDELLEALKQLYSATPDCEGGDIGQACRMARAAIAKVEGR